MTKQYREKTMKSKSSYTILRENEVHFARENK